jgi:hypothetical protein
MSIVEIIIYISFTDVMAVLNKTGNVMFCDVTLRRVRATNVAVEMQKILHVLCLGF